MSTIGIQPNVQQNTFSSDKRDTDKSGTSSQKGDSNHSQSQSSGNTNIGQSQQFKEAFQLLLPLMEQLFQKFSSENPPNPELPTPTPAPMPISDITGPDIIGTEGDDTLEGTDDAETISALAGNDLLFGRQGNDTLYGGSGDDILHGDAGNDYLSGGRGINQLFGGEGDDVLATHLGSDILDGGEGNDTASIRGNIDDYSVQIHYSAASDDIPVGPGINPDDFPAPPPITENIILTNTDTGQTIDATNIENFIFNDDGGLSVNLSLNEMRQRAEPPPVETPTEPNPLLELSGSQENNLLELFGLAPGEYAALRVEDNDGNGNLSKGDTATVVTGGSHGVSQQSRILSAEDITNINAELFLNIQDPGPSIETQPVMGTIAIQENNSPNFNPLGVDGDGTNRGAPGKEGNTQ